MSAASELAYFRVNLRLVLHTVAPGSSHPCYIIAILYYIISLGCGINTVMMLMLLGDNDGVEAGPRPPSSDSGYVPSSSSSSAHSLQSNLTPSTGKVE